MKVIFTGKTVDEAIQSGLRQLNLAKEQVEIQIVELEKKGFLGIGKKDAQVKIQPLVASAPEIPVKTKKVATLVAPKTTVPAQQPSESAPTPIVAKTVSSSERNDDEAIKQIALYLTEVSKALNAPALVTVKREQNRVIYQLETNKQGLLIGKHGKMINALQYLAQVQVHYLAASKLTAVVNIGDYRERREAILKRLATNSAREAIQTGQPIFLDPMPAFERKQVHACLTDNEHVHTYSEGDEPHRYLVVEPK